MATSAYQSSFLSAGIGALVSSLVAAVAAVSAVVAAFFPSTAFGQFLGAVVSQAALYIANIPALVAVAVPLVKVVAVVALIAAFAGGCYLLYKAFRWLWESTTQPLPVVLAFLGWVVASIGLGIAFGPSLMIIALVALIFGVAPRLGVLLVVAIAVVVALYKEPSQSVAQSAKILDTWIQAFLQNPVKTSSTH